MAETTSGRRLGGLLALLMSGLLFMGAASGSAVGDENLGPRRYMLALTNTDRVHRERAALSFAEHLAAYAKSHSEAMADKGFIYHSTGPPATNCARRSKATKWQLGGENVGVGGSLESLEDAFMASDPHRKNILRRVYDHAAVGIARADDRIWITVIFYG